MVRMSEITKLTCCIWFNPPIAACMDPIGGLCRREVFLLVHASRRRGQLKMEGFRLFEENIGWRDICAKSCGLWCRNGGHGRVRDC
jgi:hypothetical protein